MYIPKFNEETRPEVLHGLMRQHPLATLVTMGTGGLFATHLPMLLEDEGTVLRGHLARANYQWKEFDAPVEALAIFQGADHYITPQWYAEKQATGKVVPTWNYATVHAYGAISVKDDVEWLRAHVSRLTQTHESTTAKPWKIEDAPEDYIAAMLRGIVGVEMRITRLEGKWKVSQNRNEADRAGVVQGLNALETEKAAAMAAMVKEGKKN